MEDAFRRKTCLIAGTTIVLFHHTKPVDDKDVPLVQKSMPDFASDAGELEILVKNKSKGKVSKKM